MAWEPPPEVGTAEALSTCWLLMSRASENHHEWFTKTLEWGDRLSRLFAVACCRAAFDKKLNAYSQGLLNLGEKYADGRVTEEEWIAGADSIFDDTLPQVHTVVAAVASMKPEFAAGLMATLKRHRETSGKILQAIVGPRGVWADEWRTETVVELAQGIYDNHAWDRMPVLSDALQDAGCNDHRVNGFCSGQGPFCRGCWILDRILQLR